MVFYMIGFCLLAIVTAIFGAESAIIPGNDDEILDVDVCIIGGGASGTYAAIRLNDMGKKIVVVEQNNELGGHVHSYKDLGSNQTIDYGAYNFADMNIARKYLDRLGVSVVKEKNSLSTWNMDIRTGKHVKPDDYDVERHFREYKRQLAKYPFLGSWNNLPDPIPEDLLMPFGEFVAKYRIGGIVKSFARIFDGILEQPTIYVMRIYREAQLKESNEGYLHVSSRDSHEIYDKALQILQHSVLLQSRVTHLKKGNSYQILHIQTPEGIKMVRSKKLLITINPILRDLIEFDLDAKETVVFDQLQPSGFYIGVVHCNNSGVLNDHIIMNSDQNTEYQLPVQPAVLKIRPSDTPDYLVVDYKSHSILPDEYVKAKLLSSFKVLLGKIPGISPGEPKLVAYRSHSPFFPVVSAKAIRKGFYRDLNSLQGVRNTFYTGGAFDNWSSGDLWTFTENLLPNLLAPGDASAWDSEVKTQPVLGR